MGLFGPLCTFASQPTVGTDIKKAIIAWLDLSMTNLSENNNPGLEVQQKIVST